MFKKIRESAENALKSTVESTIHAFRDISTPTFESILSLEEVEAREKQAALSNAPPLPPVVPFVVLHEKPIEAFAMIKDALVIFLHELRILSQSPGKCIQLSPD